MSDALALVKAMTDLNNTLKSQVSRQSKSNTETLASSVFSPEDIEKQNNFLKEQAKIFEDLNMSQKEQEEFYKRSGSYLEDLKNEFEKTGKASSMLSKSFGDFLNKVLGGYPAKLKKMSSSAVEAIKKIGDIKSNMTLGFKSSMKELKAINAYVAKEGGGAAMKASMFTKLLGSGFSKVLGPIGTGLKMLGGAMISVFVTGIKYGTKFVKFMTALPLAITSAAAKIGNSLRSDIIETIGTAAEALQDTFSFEGNLGQGLQLMHGAAKDSLLAAKDVRGEFVRLFGFGAQGAANMLNELGQGLSGMAQFADTVGHSITTSKESFVEFYKATKILGMGAEEIKYFAMESMKNLKPINQTLDSLGQSLKTTAKSFSVDLKLLSKNFFQLRKDIINFGHLSDLQLTETSAKLTQMGVSADQALAVFNKFQTFEDAAQSAALLSQTFGMNVDALQLIKAEKPEEIIEMFRDSMYMTGRTFDEMNRHEKGVLAQYTGMSAEALNMIMNFRDMNMSYEEIQEKMKETDPQQMQIKSLQGMEHALKEVKKTITGESFFGKFFDGISSSIVLGTEFQKTFFRASETMEDFFLKGIKMSDDPQTKSALENMLKPFKDAIESVVGDGEGNKGIFDPDILGGTIKKLVNYTGGIMETLYKNTDNGGKGILELQRKVAFDMSTAFSWENLKNNPANPVFKLMETSGKFVGTFLKAFAAIGPGVFETIVNIFDGLTSWLDGGAAGAGDSITEMMKEFFGLEKEDISAIKNTFEKLIEALISASGPLMRLFKFVQIEFVKLAATIGSELATGVFNAVNPFSTGGVFANLFTSNKDTIAEGVAEAEKFNYRLRDIKSKKYQDELLEGSDATQLTRLGGIKSVLTQQQKLFAENSTQGKAIAEALMAIEEKGTSFDTDTKMQAFVENTLRPLFKTLKAPPAKESNTSSVSIKVKKANDWFSDLFGGGNSIMQSTGGGNYSLTSLNPGDQILAGMKDGPLVNAIRYSGDIAASVAKVFAGLGSANESKEVAAESGTASVKPIEVTLMIDKEKLTTVLLSNDILGKGSRYEYTRGATMMRHNAIQNLAGGSTEGSALG